MDYLQRKGSCIFGTEKHLYRVRPPF